MKPYLVVFKALSFGVAGNAAIDAVPCSVAQSCLALWNPIGFNPTGSSVHGISQAVILEWVAISFSRGLPHPGIKPASPVLQADSSPLSHQGSTLCESKG